MARKDIGTGWDRNNRNAINDNFRELYDELKDAGMNAKEAREIAFESNALGLKSITMSTNAELNAKNAKSDAKVALQYTVGRYLKPVDTFNDIDSVYPDPEENDRVFVRDTGKVFVFQKSIWTEFQEINAGPVNEVDSRLTSQLDDISINIKKFGAISNDKNIVSYPRSVGSNLKHKITQQTKTGKAIEDAINALPESGGVVYIPPGKWYVQSYITILRSNVTLRGAGSQSELILLDEIAPSDGFGCLQIGVQASDESDDVIENVSIENLKIDGNALNKPKMVQEKQAYNIVVYSVENFKISNVESINAPIDALCISSRFVKNGTVFQSTFQNSYRNTVTVGNGEKVTFINCNISGGGKIHGGTNPRSSLDVEPNTSAVGGGVKDLKFVNCNFSDSVNPLAQVIWCESIEFENCSFTETDASTSPIFINTSRSKVRFKGCKFTSTKGLVEVSHKTVIRNQAIYEDTLEQALNADVHYENCESFGVGLEAQGHNIFMSNCIWRDAPASVWVFSALAKINDNLFENIGLNDPNGGRYSSVSLFSNTSLTKRINFNNNIIRFNSDRFIERSVGDLIDAGISKLYGIYVNNPLNNLNIELTAINNRVEGYYKAGEEITGAQMPNNFRDFERPSYWEIGYGDRFRVFMNSEGGSEYKKEDW